MNTVEPKKKYQYKTCEKCGQYKKCTWHHVYRRSGKAYIWLCVFSNYKNGCHEDVHDNVGRSFAEGYLKSKFGLPVMKKEPKKCKHLSSYYSAQKDAVICQFCGKEVKEVTNGKAETEKKPIMAKFKKQINVQN
jgi:ribosomal protein S27E